MKGKFVVAGQIREWTYRGIGRIEDFLINEAEVNPNHAVILCFLLSFYVRGVSEQLFTIPYIVFREFRN